MILRTALLAALLLALEAPSTGVNAAESESRHLAVAGSDRTYRLHLPPSLDRAAPAALIIMLHGGYGAAAQAERAYGWDSLADRSGFVVAYPDGIGRSWNAGGICCGPAMRGHVDDIAFITALIQDISRTQPVDPKRVYLTGISNGGAMAYRYACEGPYPVAAVGSVSGSMSFACPAPHAVSVMEIHGTDDQNIPLDGGIGPRVASQVAWLPVARTLDMFRQAAHCQALPAREDGAVRIAAARCAADREVTLVTIAGAGHQWPGGRPPAPAARMLLPLDPPSTALDATAMLWDFFKAHPAP